MSNTDWLSSILKDFDTWCLCGNKECGLSENYKEAKQAIEKLIDEAYKKGYIDGGIAEMTR
jgi:hypothetical protein